MVIICTKAATFMRRLKTDRSGTKTPVSLMYGKKAGTVKDKNTDEGQDNISHIQLELWANAQNFYLLKIRVFSNLEWCNVYLCIQPYHVINLNTCTRHHSAGYIFEINFVI